MANRVYNNLNPHQYKVPAENMFLLRNHIFASCLVVAATTYLLFVSFEVEAGHMMGGGGKKGHGGSSGVEAMLVAGILAKLLSSSEKKGSSSSQTMYVPMPMVYSMGGHGMGGYGMGGHVMGGMGMGHTMSWR